MKIFDRISYSQSLKKGIIYLWVLVVIILAPVLVCNAQTNPNFTLPSPNASSLGEYGDVPVSKFTGIPNVQVPIYEIKVGDHTLPISISYHGGGVKVAKLASSVGLGWTLNAGGAIIRTVRGELDESSVGFFEKGHIIQQQSPGSIDYSVLNKVKNGSQDPQPDHFVYNFAGQTGKMVYRPESSSSGNFLTIPKSNLDISDPGIESGGHIGSWTITDENGTIYKFENVEKSMSWDHSNHKPGMVQPTSWYLSTIEYTNGQKIYFHYTGIESSQQQNSITYRMKVEKKAGGNWNLQSPDQEEAEYTTLSNSKYLERIVTPSEKIIFETEERDDHDSELRYSAIKIKRNGEIAKTIKLHQGYFITRDEECTSLQSQANQTKRLRLDELSIDGHQGNNKKTYQFDYFDDRKLPKRCSYATDHWGYYNGAYQNDTNDNVLPAAIVPDKRFANGGRQIELEGADKEPNFSFAKIGTLQRITYPTGGWTEFEYEPNSYSYIGDNPITVYSDVKSNFDVTAYNEGGLPGVSKKDTISVPYDQIVDLHGIIKPGPLRLSDATFIQDQYDPFQNLPARTGPAPPTLYRPYFSKARESENDGRIYIDQIGGNQLLFKGLLGNCYDSRDKKTVCDPVLVGAEKEDRHLFLQGGEQYVFTARALGYEDYVNIGITYSEELAEVQEKTAGGLRIKKITTYDGINHANDMVRTFYYDDKDNPNRSSGSVIAEPKYTFWVGLADYPNSKWLIRYSTSNTSAAPKGANVVYEHVVEKLGPNEEQGAIHQEFYSLQKRLTNFPSQTYAPFEPLPNFWKVGSPLKTKIIDGSGNVLRVEENDYRTRLQQQVKSLYYNPLLTIEDSQSEAGGIDIGFSKIKYRKTGWKYITQKESTIFDEGGDKLTSSVQYFRDDISHKQLTKKIETNSDGQQRIMEYKYAHEVSSDGRGNSYLPMRDLNMLTQPYSVTIKNGLGFVLQKKFTFWDMMKGKWVPESKWIWAGGNPDNLIFQE